VDIPTFKELENLENPNFGKEWRKYFHLSDVRDCITSVDEY